VPTMNTIERTALQTRVIRKGRNPLLRVGSTALLIFQHLRMYPGQTIDQIAKALSMEYQSVNGMIQRMKRHGLIIKKPVQKGNRVISGYYIINENETGVARDVVDIITTIYVNDYGEYSCQSRIGGQAPTARLRNPKPIHQVVHQAAVPKPTEPHSTRDIFDESFTGEIKEGLIIDGSVVKHDE
jgi:biotin operon repressor